MKNFACKSAVALCICVGLCWCDPSIIFAGSSDGKGSKHISTGRILEFSLRNLKESLKETKQNNDRLIFENDALRKDIQELKRVLRNLSSKKAQLFGQPSASFDHESKMFFIETFDHKGREKKARELTSIFEKDVSVLREEVQLLDSQLDDDRFNFQKQLLLGREKEGREKISKVEKRVKSLNKKSRRPEKTIKALESEKSILGKKLTILQERNAFY